MRAKSVDGIQLFILLIAVFLLLSVARAQNLNNEFDSTGGNITYYSLNEGNWSGGGWGIDAQSGTVALMSANGNDSGTFSGIGIAQTYDQVISDQIYQVSFAIGKYADIDGMELSDFNSLYIGGPSGLMEWTETPQPQIDGEWLTWSGTYTPSIDDLGLPISFEAVFDLDAQHAIALDGPITAVPSLPLNNSFDLYSGSNDYVSLEDGNWISGSGFGITVNAGFEALLSANGNENFDFNDIGIIKNLGGIIQDESYDVSLYVGKYNNLAGIEFSDFASLYVGSPNGTMTWVATPSPENDGEWVQWQGVFTPAPEDIGSPFIFEAIFDLDSQHSIALDGPLEIKLMPVSTDIPYNHPNHFKLLENYPNPFNPETTISFELEKRSFVELKVYNHLGQEVSHLFTGALPPGIYSNKWYAGSHPSGLYFYKLTNRLESQVGSMVLIK